MAKLSRHVYRKLLSGMVVLVSLIATYLLLTGVPYWNRVFQATGLAPSPTTATGEMEVHFIGVGNADCILIRQGEHAALLDVGERGDGDSICRYLSRCGVKALDFILVSHPHSDHIGGASKVLRTVPVQCVYMQEAVGEDVESSPIYQEFIETLIDTQTPVIAPSVGDVVMVGTAHLEVLSPLYCAADTNAMSMATKLTFGQHRFLFVGDMPAGTESALPSSGCDVSADVLKIAHHGSKESSSTAFLQAVAPTYGVITSGMGNHYGHPAQRVLDDLAQLNCRIIRLDVVGNALFKTDGVTLHAETRTEKQG